ncbi:MAG TPA: phospholipase D-like domain-containing protein [Allosphingosinicella sp.]|nr:phospholipase D-like domain-containing protein [Allosphingosinicella sp.]
MADPPLPRGAAGLVEGGRNCWRIRRAERAALIVDAADYYRIAREAMLKARARIMLIGWDVDTRVSLTPDEPTDGAPAQLGQLVTWLAKNRLGLEIHILAWDQAALSLLGRGRTFLRLLRWRRKPRIHVQFDHAHPLEGSHHQKILVIDDAIAFCGGIDITGARWDTRGHCDHERKRVRAFTRRRYAPWHDAILAVDGDAARSLGELARQRWETATGEKLGPGRGGGDPWPDALEPLFRDVDVAIARTRAAHRDAEEIREIEALFVDMIAAAKRLVYVETQYFASRVVAEAIARRLDEPDPPEFVIVNPRTAYGWLDGAVMTPARAELVETLKARRHGERLRIYSPVTEEGNDIYVHAKIMIVDDLLLRVGSANLNNRSMGLDSECDLVVDGRGRDEVRATIARIMCDLLGEHLGMECEAVARCIAETGSVGGAIERLRGRGRTLVPLEPRAPAIGKALARTELLDPEAPGELFEPRARPGLLSHLRR